MGDISEKWGHAAWFAWQWTICRRTQADIGFQCGYTHPATVNNHIARFIRFWDGAMRGCYDEERHKRSELALARYIDAGGICIEPEPIRHNKEFTEKEFSAARLEHAFLMRCDGEAYKEIGDRLGLSRERVRKMVDQMGRRLNRSMRRTHFIISSSSKPAISFPL